jgi:23S rRNA pseudouridine1911/1915/1917 synthase
MVIQKESLIAPHSTVTLSPVNNTQKIRIDRYLTDQFPAYSRSFFKKLIDEGFISVNDVVINKQSCPVTEKDTVVVRFPGERSITGDSIIARNLAIEIIAEHDHFYIINKPAGLIVHPPKTNSGMVTLMDWLLHHHQELQAVGYVDRPGIVHRLDKDTSGLMVIPRTNIAHKQFSDFFKDRKMSKTYIALVHGHPDKEGIIEYPIGRHPQQRMKMYAYPEVTLNPLSDESTKRIRSAVTHYTVLEYYK